MGIATYDLAQKCPGALKLVLIPDPLQSRSRIYLTRLQLQWIRDQFWFIAQRRTIVGVMYYNQKLSHYLILIKWFK